MSARRTVFHTCAALVVAAVLFLAQIVNAQASVFSFALMGDQPYNTLLEAATESLIQHINSQDDIQWILHIGDIKGGAEPCTDALLKQRIKQLNRSEKPLVYVPGDNEWTDCHRPSNGNFNSQERLNLLRELAFRSGTSLGENTFSVRQQSSPAYPEHLMWQQGSTLFISLNIPGSNNDLHNPKSRNTDAATVQRLFNQRQQAIQAWLDEAEALFKTPGTTPTETVIALQGNPIDGSGRGKQDGYLNLMKSVVSYINSTQRPVLLLHGDTHRFKWDRPSLRKYGGTPETDALLYRAESWGHPFLNVWVKVTVSPGAAAPFNVRSISQTTEAVN